MFDPFFLQSDYRDSFKRSYIFSRRPWLKGEARRDTSLYIRSALINHLFVGKDIAARQEKKIHESSRFLRVHAATP